MNMRLFIALQLPDPAIDHLRRVQAVLRPLAEDAAFTRDVNLHLTMRFLGELPEEKVSVVRETLGSLSGAGEVSLNATGIGFFPPSGGIDVIMARVAGPGAEQLKLARSAMERALRAHCTVPEERAFVPHVTLARARKSLPVHLRQKLDRAAASHWPGPAWVVKQMQLMQSIPKPSGSTYLTLQSFDL